MIVPTTGYGNSAAYLTSYLVPGGLGKTAPWAYLAGLSRFYNFDGSNSANKPSRVMYYSGFDLSVPNRSVFPGCVFVGIKGPTRAVFPVNANWTFNGIPT